MKATEQYFPVVLFLVLYKVVLTFAYADEISKSKHSNENYWAVLFNGAVCYTSRGRSKFWHYVWDPKVWPLTWEPLSLARYFPVVRQLSCAFKLFELSLVALECEPNLKGRAIRKVRRGRKGGGELQNKNFMQGKIERKKIMHSEWPIKTFLHTGKVFLQGKC